MYASRRFPGLAVAAALFAGGCLDRTVPVHAIDRAPDEAALSALLVEQQYRGAGFVRLDRAAYQSTWIPSDTIHIYASSDAAALYQQIAPETPPTASMSFPVGGIIVREVIDGRGQVTQLTLAARLGAGFFPEGGDLFYAVTDAGGAAVPSSDGSHLLWGRLGECAGCHAERAQQSYLFGVDAAQHAAP
jgi:hypothetical protein